MLDNKPLVAVDIRELADPHPAGKTTVLKFVLRELFCRSLVWRPILYSRELVVNSARPNQAFTRIIRGVSGFRPIELAADMKKSGAKLAVFPTGYIVTPFIRIPYVLFVYDLVAFTKYAKTLPIRTRLAERFLLPLAARKAVQILAISEFTKQELIRILKIPAAKITVFPLAADQAFRPAIDQPKGYLAELKERYKLPDRFYLFVGTIEPRKNIYRILQAHQALPPEIRNQVPLFLVGKQGWLKDSIGKLINKYGASATVRHLSYIPFKDLPGFYNLATACVYPSLYEGFGLPALEAMSSGCPVVTADCSSLPEVVGEAAIKVNPLDVSAISAAMQEIVENQTLREEMIKKGFVQAKKFTWQEAAKVVDEVITNQATKSD